MECPLCKAEHLTNWYYEDDLFYFCDCKSCGIPMVVLRRHTMKPSWDEVNGMKYVTRVLFGADIRFRTEQRQIKDHLHWHIIL